jgi:Leucine-rich repeat (LRR) protein
MMKIYKNLNSAHKAREEVTILKISLADDILPNEIFDFPNLEEIYLEGSCKNFPDRITGWKKVKTISIKWNHFSGDLSEILSLENLENLKIIETPIKMFLLPLGLIKAPLKSLTIKSCGLEKLPEEISMCSRLQELSLPGNKISSLPYSFTDLKELRRLNLDANQFKLFPDQIKKMSRLHHLSIDGNQFSEEEKERIQREFHLTIN